MSILSNLRRNLCELTGSKERLFRCFAGTQWMQSLIECQRTLAASDPHPHYLNAYMDEETAYWVYLPKWIYEDGQVYPCNSSLDIGCAYGTLALFCRRVLGCDTYCSDFTDAYFTKRLLQLGIHFAQNNIELEPLPWDRQFDIVVFSEVLEHLRFSPLPTLQKIHHLLAPEGRLYLSTPDAAHQGRLTTYHKDYRKMPDPVQVADVIDDHVYIYTKRELVELVSDAGFTIVRLNYSPGICGRHLNMTLMCK